MALITVRAPEGLDTVTQPSRAAPFPGGPERMRVGLSLESSCGEAKPIQLAKAGARAPFAQPYYCGSSYSYRQLEMIQDVI
jgi:hypothetical protein